VVWLSIESLGAMSAAGLRGITTLLKDPYMRSLASLRQDFMQDDEVVLLSVNKTYLGTALKMSFQRSGGSLLIDMEGHHGAGREVSRYPIPIGE
jgi:hypothetical protein